MLRTKICLIVSSLCYEYEGLNLLRIDQRYDSDEDEDIDSNDDWRPMNGYVHAPGSIGQIVRSKWYSYIGCDKSPCDSGYYYYLYDALGVTYHFKTGHRLSNQNPSVFLDHN